ncbi:gpW family head-tail joining protein [Teredinibacter sp. KSP-S5-2]|uniref:gpW family head-tail joining protein n=1 Tax=Teredinibacter sp. KSP-S5-2 TaxID=3034506 RepID=UPI00293508BC|nr:gpW family head-tail joining protein [Teredinibacter sp. KSP-S5-2]WNO10423.1 gpW family head-tail joining protein [Teredinibacter sp. KSP-S5-2]
MADIAILKTRLEEAEMALHKLMTGAREVKVKVDDYGETTFSETNMANLERYIAKLKQDIARALGRPRRKPLFIKF